MSNDAEAQARCFHCDYRFGAIASDRCPECGALIGTPSNPINARVEKHWGFTRRMTLYPGTIVIRDRQWGGSSSEITIPLKCLYPEPDRFRVRHAWFKNGLVILPLASAFLFVGLRGRDLGNVFLLGLSVCGTCIGLLMLLCTVRPVEWIVFRSGVSTRAIPIAKVGPEAAKFDEFAVAVMNQIRVSRPATQASGT